jgi:hypothetical protein
VDVIAVASIPKKLQFGAEIQVVIADMFDHKAPAGKSLSIKKGENTLFFTLISDSKPKPGEYKFTVDVDFSVLK